MKCVCNQPQIQNLQSYHQLKCTDADIHEIYEIRNSTVMCNVNTEYHYQADFIEQNLEWIDGFLYHNLAK